MRVNSSLIQEISVDEVAKLCFDKYESLPKTGKPSSSEWTILAGVILNNKETGKNQVISIGSGTKCLGKSKLCTQGLILNDSHAEVMARRGLIRYMYHQLKEASAGKEAMFLWVPEKQKFKLKDELSLHFLSTQTPCGDACINTPLKSEECTEEPLVKKSKLKEQKSEDANVGFITDAVYTGAKLIGSNYSDAMEQIVGAVRTKPGRGERTISMSCSDKLAKWQVMGMQGALLDFLLTTPLYFTTLNFWGANNFDSLERAIWKRFEHNEFSHFRYRVHIPQIRTFNKPEFPYAQNSTKQPSPNGLVWCDIPTEMKPYEISVNGKRQGITRKKLYTPQSALKISKFFLFKEFIDILKLNPDLLPVKEDLENKTYFECKFFAKDYQAAWSDLKTYYFKQWSQKPVDLLKFCVKEVENKDVKKTL